MDWSWRSLNGLHVPIGLDKVNSDGFYNWYEAEVHSARYALERLARRIARASGRDGVIPVDQDSDTEA